MWGKGDVERILNALQIKGRDTNIVVNEKYCIVIKGISMQIFQNSHVYLSWYPCLPPSYILGTVA